MMRVPSPDDFERVSKWLESKVLGSELDWARLLLHYATGRPTLRPFANVERKECFEEDEDGVKVEIYDDPKAVKDLPTAGTCTRTLFLPVCDDAVLEENFSMALMDFKAANEHAGGARIDYQ